MKHESGDVPELHETRKTTRDLFTCSVRKCSIRGTWKTQVNYLGCSNQFFEEREACFSIASTTTIRRCIKTTAEICRGRRDKIREKLQWNIQWARTGGRASGLLITEIRFAGMRLWSFYRPSTNRASSSSVAIRFLRPKLKKGWESGKLSGCAFRR